MNEEYNINEILLAVKELNKRDKKDIVFEKRAEKTIENKGKIPQDTMNIIKQAENYINKK